MIPGHPDRSRCVANLAASVAHSRNRQNSSFRDRRFRCRSPCITLLRAGRACGARQKLCGSARQDQATSVTASGAASRKMYRAHRAAPITRQGRKSGRYFGAPRMPVVSPRLPATCHRGPGHWPSGRSSASRYRFTRGQSPGRTQICRKTKPAFRRRSRSARLRRAAELAAGPLIGRGPHGDPVLPWIAAAAAFLRALPH